MTTTKNKSSSFGAYGNIAIAKYEAQMHIHRYLNVLENAKPSRETYRWRSKDEPTYSFRKQDGKMKLKFKSIKKDNEKLCERIYSIMTDHRETKTVEYAPGFRIGRGGTVIDCYPTRLYDNEKFKDLHGRQHTRKKNELKISKENNAFQSHLHRLKSPYSAELMKKDYDKNRYLSRILFSKTPQTVLHLGLVEAVKGRPTMAANAKLFSQIEKDMKNAKDKSSSPQRTPSKSPLRSSLSSPLKSRDVVRDIAADIKSPLYDAVSSSKEFVNINLLPENNQSHNQSLELLRPVTVSRPSHETENDLSTKPIDSDDINSNLRKSKDRISEVKSSLRPKSAGLPRSSKSGPVHDKAEIINSSPIRHRPNSGHVLGKITRDKPWEPQYKAPVRSNEEPDSSEEVLLRARLWKEQQRQLLDKASLDSMESQDILDLMKSRVSNEKHREKMRQRILQGRKTQPGTNTVDDQVTSSQSTNHDSVKTLRDRLRLPDQKEILNVEQAYSPWTTWTNLTKDGDENGEDSDDHDMSMEVSSPMAPISAQKIEIEELSLKEVLEDTEKQLLENVENKGIDYDFLFSALKYQDVDILQSFPSRRNVLYDDIITSTLHDRDLRVLKKFREINQFVEKNPLTFSARILDVGVLCPIMSSQHWGDSSAPVVSPPAPNNDMSLDQTEWIPTSLGVYIEVFLHPSSLETYHKLKKWKDFEYLNNDLKALSPLEKENSKKFLNNTPSNEEMKDIKDEEILEDTMGELFIPMRQLYNMAVTTKNTPLQQWFENHIPLLYCHQPMTEEMDGSLSLPSEGDCIELYQCMYSQLTPVMENKLITMLLHVIMVSYSPISSLAYVDINPAKILSHFEKQ